MKFMLDENVTDRVRVLLEKSGFEVGFIRDIIPTGSPDPLVAFVSENKSAILVSHDGDFRKIPLVFLMVKRHVLRILARFS